MYCTHSKTLPHKPQNQRARHEDSSRVVSLLCCFPLMSWLMLLLTLMLVCSLWSCSALCWDSAVISSVSIPRIFGRVCTVSLKSTLQTLLPKSLSLPLMCGECCLSAPLSLSLSLFPPFVFLLFESELLLFCRHKAMPHSLVFTHVSPSKSSPLQLHFPFFLSPSFMHLLYSFLYSCSVSVLVFVLPRKLSLPFHAYTCTNTHTHTQTIKSTYLQ